MRIGIALKAMRPRLAVHADSGAVAACVAKTRVERQGTCLRIEIHHEQTVLPLFSRIHNNAAAVRVSGEPVRLLLLIECNPRYFADMA